MNESSNEEPVAEVREHTFLTEQEQQFVSELGDYVADHEVRLERLEQKAKEPDVPRDWITRHTDRTSWEELADWVDWLNRSYSMLDERRVPDCWPAHPGLVHVLAGLRSAWAAAVLSDEGSKEAGNAMAAFHDYHLFPFFARLSDPQFYRCGQSHHGDEQHAKTRRDLFPDTLADGSVNEATGGIEETWPTSPTPDAR